MKMYFTKLKNKHVYFDCELSPRECVNNQFAHETIS